MSSERTVVSIAPDLYRKILEQHELAAEALVDSHGDVHREIVAALKNAAPQGYEAAGTPREVDAPSKGTPAVAAPIFEPSKSEVEEFVSEGGDKKQDGATTVWGPELQNRPGGPIYRLGTSTGVTLPPQPERVTNTREEPSKAVLEWAQSLLNACQHQKRNDHPNGFAFWAAWPTWEGMAKAVLARSSTARVSVPRATLEEWALWLKGRREVAGQVALDSIEEAIKDILAGASSATAQPTKEEGT